MKIEKLKSKELTLLKSKHIDKYHYHEEKAYTHKKILKVINDIEVERLLKRWGFGDAKGDKSE